MEHRVIAYSGCSYANEPREFYIGEVHHRVSRVESAAVVQEEDVPGLTLSVWDIVDETGARFRLTYHWVSDFWEIAGT